VTPAQKSDADELPPRSTYDANGRATDDYLRALAARGGEDGARAAELLAYRARSEEARRAHDAAMIAEGERRATARIAAALGTVDAAELSQRPRLTRCYYADPSAIVRENDRCTGRRHRSGAPVTRVEAKRRLIAVGAMVANSAVLIVATCVMPRLAERWPLAGLMFAQWASCLWLDRWADK
jgi:hypothetical protein